MQSWKDSVAAGTQAEGEEGGQVVPAVVGRRTGREPEMDTKSKGADVPAGREDQEGQEGRKVVAVEVRNTASSRGSFPGVGEVHSHPEEVDRASRAAGDRDTEGPGAGSAAGRSE